MTQLIYEGRLAQVRKEENDAIAKRGQLSRGIVTIFEIVRVRRILVNIVSRMVLLF